MKPRNVLLLSTAAGVALGGLTWYVTQRMTEAGEVTPMNPGETFPTLTGTTLAGETLTLPETLEGKIGLLILADRFAARYEVEEWARYVLTTYGDQPELTLYEVPLISGVGPMMQRMIDAAMKRGTQPKEQSRVLTVYGDLRGLKRRLGISGNPKAYVMLLGRTGRLAWRMEGPLTEEKRRELDVALKEQEIGELSEP